MQQGGKVIRVIVGKRKKIGPTIRIANGAGLKKNDVAQGSHRHRWMMMPMDERAGLTHSFHEWRVVNEKSL